MSDVEQRLYRLENELNEVKLNSELERNYQRKLILKIYRQLRVSLFAMKDQLMMLVEEMESTQKSVKFYAAGSMQVSLAMAAIISQMEVICENLKIPFDSEGWEGVLPEEETEDNSINTVDDLLKYLDKKEENDDE